MATQTVRLRAADSDRVRWEYDYDDVALNVTQYRCINNSDQGPTPAPAYGKLWMQSNPARFFEATTLAGASTVQNVPTAQAARLGLTVDVSSGRPRVKDLEGTFNWPA